ncbi:pilin [Patescibacteria group bacterium]|nr:pilin [Patescibacteria group bacterium]
MKKILIAFFLIIIGLFSFSAVPALAQGGVALEGLDKTAGVAEYTTGESANLTNVVGGLIGSLLGVLGIVFVILLIYGGIRYMTASGDETHVKEAKSLLIAATVGLIITISAYAIASFTLSRLSIGLGIDNQGKLICDPETGVCVQGGPAVPSD